MVQQAQGSASDSDSEDEDEWIQEAPVYATPQKARLMRGAPAQRRSLLLQRRQVRAPGGGVHEAGRQGERDHPNPQVAYIKCRVRFSGLITNSTCHTRC